MDLRVSVVLLFIFLTGGYSLKCYSCISDSTGSCDAKEQACLLPGSKCGNIIVVKNIGSNKMSIKTKACVPGCVPVTLKVTEEGSMSNHCCDTDLCNAADGVFKGSFLLLFSPLLFYFLFQ